jgi:hypothetical protein
MTTVAMLDHLLEQGTKVVLVECDTSNPGVWNPHREQVETELINLGEADGSTLSTRATGTARGRGDQRGGPQQPGGQAERTHARQQPGGARKPARGYVDNQPAPRHLGPCARSSTPSGRRRCIAGAISIKVAAQELSIGNRAELGR